MSLPDDPYDEGFSAGFAAQEERVSELQAEIKRLRAALKESESMLCTTMVERLKDENDRLQAEIERLRAELRHARRDYNVGVGWKSSGYDSP